jgi:transposase
MSLGNQTKAGEEVAPSMVPSVRSKMNQLLREGVPKAQAARQLGVSRQTVYNWIAKEKEEAEPKQRPSKLDPFKPYIESRLARFDIPATVLLREIRDRGYGGGITILREFASEIKSRHVRRLVDRFETEPGRQAQVDWGSCGLIELGGRRRRLSLLAVVLGHSRLIWARFVVSERRPVLMRLLEDCFAEIDGVPKELLFDNLKQVVARPRTAEAPAEIQMAFSAFADHWGFEVVASPPYWPRAKGKVERAIGYIKSSFLEGRSFTDLDDLNTQLRIWLAEVANIRIHGTTGERPTDRLSADQKAMLPVGHLPAFPSMSLSPRLADHDGRISYQGVTYSVDPEILTGRRGEPVNVLEGTDRRIRIFHQGRIVGDHAILPSGSPPQDDPMHAAKRRQLRQQPTWSRPKTKAPRFDQRVDETPGWMVVAPAVHERPLTSYEVAS